MRRLLFAFIWAFGVTALLVITVSAISIFRKTTTRIPGVIEVVVVDTPHEASVTMSPGFGFYLLFLLVAAVALIRTNPKPVEGH